MIEGKVLFVCTGNYYRSRFAEIFYNSLVSSRPETEAFSRGLEAFRARNEGPISKYAIEYLRKLRIEVDAPRYPLQLTIKDLHISDHVIFMDEEEHRPMWHQYFPEEDRELIFWKFQDIQYEKPSTVLPKLESKIKELAL